MDGEVVIGTKLDTKSFDKQISKVSSELTQLQAKEKELISLNESYANAKGKALMVSTKEYQIMQKLGITMEDIGNKKSFVKLQDQIEKASNKLITLRKKQEEINKEGTTKFQKSLSSIGEGVDKVTHKIGKWALAIIGVRSAYMLIRNAINIITQQDEKLANDITYIKTALAYTLEPIVRAIVDLMKQLMYYVAYIVKAWTGRDIFAKANKGLKNATSSAKELNKELDKTIASFDEMDVLQSNQNANANVGGVGGTGYSLGDFEAPKWLQWIAKNKKLILNVLAGIVSAIIAMKLGLKGIKALGIGIAVVGLITSIENLIKFINDPTFENFTGILEGIAIAVVGIGIAIGNLPLIIAGAITLIVVEIVKHFDEIKDLFNKLINWMDVNILGKLRELFGPVGDWLYLPLKIAVDSIQTMFENLFGGIKKIFEGIVQIANGDLVGGLKTIFSGLTDILLAPFRTMKKVVSDIFTTVLNTFIDIINGLIDAVNTLPFINIGHISRIGQKSKGVVTSSVGSRAKGGIFYPNLLPKLAIGGIINNPGPGVPYHGATIGERGAEAVVPLTDSQQMELLGETIGRYITVNATIPVYAYNRQVDKQIRTIRAEDDFAYNR